MYKFEIFGIYIGGLVLVLSGNIFLFFDCKVVKLLSEPISSTHLTNQEIRAFKYSNICGPPIILNEKLSNCYNHESDQVKYEFCPFENVTQIIVSNNFGIFNSKKIVLGVWGYWIIENDYFSKAVYDFGEPCNEFTNRSIHIELVCGTEYKLKNVTEPKFCEYLAIFSSPLVCNKKLMLAYNSLNESLKFRFDQLKELFNKQFITKKGLLVGKSDLYGDAGYKMLNNHSSLLKDLYKNKIITNLLTELKRKSE